MKYNIISIFPQMFESLNDYGVLGKAIDKGLIELNPIDLRDFSENKHNKVDDEIYGGGPGMLFRPEPLYRAISSVKSPGGKTIYMSPQGKTLDNNMAIDLSSQEELTIVCGHYEGIDQRIIDNYIDYEISIGDYIITGGELAAMVLIDTVSRFVDGVVGNNQSVVEDTFYNNLLKYPNYTRPRVFKGFEVPDILLSGDHSKIEKWRKEKAIEVTRNKRPDLLD